MRLLNALGGVDIKLVSRQLKWELWISISQKATDTFVSCVCRYAHVCVYNYALFLKVTLRLYDFSLLCSLTGDTFIHERCVVLETLSRDAKASLDIRCQRDQREKDCLGGLHRGRGRLERVFL